MNVYQVRRKSDGLFLSHKHSGNYVFTSKGRIFRTITAVKLHFHKGHELLDGLEVVTAELTELKAVSALAFLRA
jgi:hypothetical protein